MIVGTWLSLVEHRVRDAGAAGSNPVVPTSNINNYYLRCDLHLFFLNKALIEIDRS